MRRRPRRVSRHRKPLRLPVRPRLMSLCRNARLVLQRRTRRRSAVRGHGPPVRRSRDTHRLCSTHPNALHVQRAHPNRHAVPPRFRHSAPSQAPVAQRAQVDRLRQQQQRELRSQAGRVAPARLNELRAQQRQQLEQLQTQQNQARQRELTGRSNQPASNQPSMGQNAARVAPQVAARIAPDAARQGRFAAAFAPRSALASAEAFPNWTAWRLRRPAAFVPWSGALFWPYVYTDMFYYAFWPGAYDEGYWAYAYDDLLDGAYWAYGDPYAAYAYVGPNPDTAGLTGGRVRTRAASGRDVAAACEQSANVADWPFGQIEAAIAPTPEQQQLLNNLKSAANQAANMLRTSCPSSFPLTPPGRLQAMTARLDATLRAVDLVRPLLARFYDLLSDEQKARFNAIGPELGHEGVRAAGKSQAEAEGACGKAKPGLIDLPIGQIEAVVGTNRRAGAGPRSVARGQQPGRRHTAVSVPAGDRADPGRPPRCDARSAGRDAQCSEDAAAGAQRLLRVAQQRAKGGVQHAGTGGAASGLTRSKKHPVCSAARIVERAELRA